jgi:hypothetical protein
MKDIRLNQQDAQSKIESEVCPIRMLSLKD